MYNGYFGFLELPFADTKHSGALGLIDQRQVGRVRRLILILCEV